MSRIVEFAETRNNTILLDAGKKLEDTYRASQLSYENLLLNHMGSLLGINDCEYFEAMQFFQSDLLKSNKDKANRKLKNLSDRGYKKATLDLAADYISENPQKAINYYLECLKDSSVDQGEIYERIGSIYVDRDELETKDAFQYLKLAADQYNRGLAQYMVACFYFYGTSGIEKDIELSYSYCLKAANNDESRALEWLGRDYIAALEYPLEQNVELGLKYLKRAAQLNNENAQYYLGLLFYEGEDVQKDLQQAEGFFEQAMKSDVPGAYAYLGKMNFERGNYSKAKELLEISYYKHKKVLCAEYLVKIFKDGLGCSPDFNRAVRIIDDMVENSSSNYEDVEFAANCYYEGKSVPRNVDKAVRYYSILEDNNPSVKYKLGCIALDGSSTILSKNDCIRYFEYAGNNGFPIAFSKLAYYFLSINNADRAFEYFKRSYQAGNIDDGVMVGRIFEAGTPSMIKNMTEAVKWYKDAAAKGSIKAKEELTHIRSGIFGYKRI